ncbi:MAG: response regulator [Ferrovibrio sp.]|uniref:response regulator n=1 Tax=Ferrovibrio sp. TaxID=1917215 RepID=UPI003919344F
MPYDLSRLDLLLVEADPGMQATWRSLFVGLGIRRPLCVPGTAQAWTALANPIADATTGGKIDVMICRWELPGFGADGAEDGLAFARRLRQDPASPNPFLPIIIATASVTRDRVRAALDAGVNEILVLPPSARALETRLREIIERPRTFVRGESYFGPDRRRQARADYPGPFRRGDDRRRR